MTIFNPDDSEVTEIVLPDGSQASEVVAPDGSVVWTAAADIPDSVVYQYVAENFGSPWPDEVQSADMTVNGLTASTFANGETSVSGDGNSDHGLADGPESLGGLQEFGIAFTIQFSAPSPDSRLGGSIASGGRINIKTNTNGPQGGIELSLSDGTNFLDVFTDNAYDDGTARAVVINKTGNTGSDIDVYVDDMTTPVPTTAATDDGFNPSNYTNERDFGFYALNNDGTIEFNTDFNAGVFEFWDSPPNQSEREGFVSRRPEV